MVLIQPSKVTVDDVGPNAAVIRPVLRCCPGRNPSVHTLSVAIDKLYTSRGLFQDVPAVCAKCSGQVCVSCVHV